MERFARGHFMKEFLGLCRDYIKDLPKYSDYVGMMQRFNKDCSDYLGLI